METRIVISLQVVGRMEGFVVSRVVLICFAYAILIITIDSIHQNNIGSLLKRECPVKIDLFIPWAWNRFPFVLLVCRGNHSHFPPPPSKLPSLITKEITDAILEHDILSLTARSLMFSPRFGTLVKQYSTSALRHIHQTLHVEDRVTALIRKQKLFHYPHGTAVAGVYREFLFDQVKPVEEQWIREVFFFDDQREKFLIICCTYEQAKMFQSARHIEMDLAFKIVSGKTNVFSITSFNREARRINTYAYVFMNLETRSAYATMFGKLFKVLGDVGRKPVAWAYQLGGGTDEAAGVRTVTLDMCKKQGPGTCLMLWICLPYANAMNT